MGDIVSYFFYFETTKKTKETMEIFKNDDDIPLKYKDTFNQIESGKLRMYSLEITAFKGMDNDNKINSDSKRKIYNKNKRQSKNAKVGTPQLYPAPLPPSKHRKNKNKNNLL